MAAPNSQPNALTPDSEIGGWLGWLPPSARGLALLARFDRPIGWWLLFWPCAWGLLLAGGARSHPWLLLWMLGGAIAMRGAGCVYNDIIDRDLDAQVARTARRPLPNGMVTMRQAWGWLVTLALCGLVVLLQLRIEAQIVAVASLALIAAYPFMKRITWWPQAWLGLVFSWGVPVGWIAVTGTASLAMLALYAAAICWVIGYDTIYAVQDREDDALIGVRSSALALGGNVRGGVAGFYGLSVKFAVIAMLLARPEMLAAIAVLPFAVHLLWQALRLDDSGGTNALALFRANRFAGLLMTIACLIVGSA